MVVDVILVHFCPFLLENFLVPLGHPLSLSNPTPVGLVAVRRGLLDRLGLAIAAGVSGF